jgi:hypothetical protein
MGHLEKNELTLPISSPELKSEIAAKLGLISNKVTQRIDDRGQAGGGRATGFEPSPRSRAYSRAFGRIRFRWKARRHTKTPGSDLRRLNDSSWPLPADQHLVACGSSQVCDASPKRACGTRLLSSWAIGRVFN